MADAPRKRIQFDRKPPLMDDMTFIAESLGLTSGQDVLAECVELTAMLLRRSLDGQRLFSGTDKDSSIEILIPKFERARLRKP